MSLLCASELRNFTVAKSGFGKMKNNNEFSLFTATSQKKSYREMFVYPVKPVRSKRSAEYGSIGSGCQSCSWSDKQKKKKILRPRSRLRIWSRDIDSAISHPASSASSFSTPRLNLALTHGVPPDFCDDVYLFMPSTAIGSLPSLSGHATAHRWRSLPRVRWSRASSPEDSSRKGCCPFQAKP